MNSYLHNTSLKYLIVFSRPDFRSTFGTQPSTFFAFSTLGWRTLGSSIGSFSKTILLLDSVTRITSLANYLTVISSGFPIFTGSVSLLINNLYIPSIKSDT